MNERKTPLSLVRERRMDSYPFFVLSKKGYAPRNRFADRGRVPCGGEGAPTGREVPTSARRVIGSDFSSPAR